MKLSSQTVSYPNGSFRNLFIRILLIRHTPHLHCSRRGREIYYRHPALFANQAVVDRYVDDIAFTFGASRSLLNVVRILSHAQFR